MATHLTKDPPTNDLKEQWMKEDVRLYLQIRYSIDNEVIGLINHCEFVKELMDYFCILGKGMSYEYLGYTRQVSYCPLHGIQENL